ncbi:MAG: sulfotransferase family protein [Thermoanaerobaculum sp.]
MAEKIVCVAGMHRSGTSAVARVVNILGCYLGNEKNLLPPAPDNPKGFWENRRLVDINVEVLRVLGRRSDDPRLPLPAHWWLAETLTDLRREAARAVAEEFGGTSFWGWKDPRNCLTLPFWRSVVGPFHVVFVVRHPLEVARSLWARGRYPESTGLYLWTCYNYQILKDLKGERFLVVAYPMLLRQAGTTVRRIAAFLGTQLTDPQLEEIASFLEPSLKHQTAGNRDWPQDFPRRPVLRAWRFFQWWHGRELPSFLARAVSLFLRKVALSGPHGHSPRQ